MIGLARSKANGAPMCSGIRTGQHTILTARCSLKNRALPIRPAIAGRSEEHTSELQSLMRISSAVFCLKKKNIKKAEGNLQIEDNEERYDIRNTQKKERKACNTQRQVGDSSK